MFFERSDWLLNQWISNAIHWFTSSSSERATPNSRKLRAKWFLSLLHRQPQKSGSSLDFEFLRECTKINKIRPKFYYSTKIEIKMTYLVFVFCYYCLFASRAIWKPFYRRLIFWVVLTVRKMGRLGTLKLTVPAPSSKLAKIADKGSADNCLSLLCFWSLRFHHNR